MKGESPKEVIDTLHLSKAQWRALSERLDEVRAGEPGRRRYERVSFRKLTQIAVAIQQPEGHWAAYAVRSRDISPAGMGFIHGMFVHTGSPCRIVLKDSQGHAVCLNGKVKCCVLLSGNAHHVGVQFDQEIDIDQFIDEVEDTDEQRQVG